MPISPELQRIVKRAEKWAIFMASSKSTGRTAVCSCSRGVVQALNKGGMESIDADHKVDRHTEQDFIHRVARVEAHTSAKEKAQMTQQNKQVVMCQ